MQQNTLGESVSGVSTGWHVQLQLGGAWVLTSGAFGGLTQQHMM
jgi:hypothetical protein